MKNFSFRIIAIGMMAFTAIACKKTTTAPTVTTPTTSTQQVSEFNGTVNGASYHYKNLENNVEDFATSDGSLRPSPDTSYLVYGSGLNLKQKNVFFVQLGLLKTTTGYPDKNTFNSFFSAGSRPFAGTDKKGVKISWWDASGHTWSTDMGSKNQSGSNFRIDNSSLYEPQYQDPIEKVNMSFSCTLYDSVGNSMKMANCTYFGAFIIR